MYYTYCKIYTVISVYMMLFFILPPSFLFFWSGMIGLITHLIHFFISFSCTLWKRDLRMSCANHFHVQEINQSDYKFYCIASVVLLQFGIHRETHNLILLLPKVCWPNILCITKLLIFPYYGSTVSTGLWNVTWGLLTS